MADPADVSVVIPAYNEGAVIAEVVAAPGRGRPVARDHRRRRRIERRHRRARAQAAGALRRPASLQQGQRRRGEERHPTRRRRVRADHRRRRPASARGRAAPRRPARRVRPRHRRARGVDTGDAGAALRQHGALNRLASYLTGRDIPDLTSGFRGARREYLREFLHLLPNGFSTPTTTTLAFIKAGYNVAFEPIEARQRVGTVEDPVRARRREVLHDHPEDRDALQPAARLPADQRSRRSRSASATRCGPSPRRAMSPTRRSCSSCWPSSCFSSAWSRSRSPRCASRAANSR